MFLNFHQSFGEIPSCHLLYRDGFFNVVLMSSVVCGYYSWFSADLTPITKMYIWCVMELLGVRKLIRNDVSYVEGDFHSLQNLNSNKLDVKCDTKSLCCLTNLLFMW